MNITELLVRAHFQWEIIDNYSITVSILLNTYSRAYIVLNEEGSPDFNQYDLFAFQGIQQIFTNVTLETFINNYTLPLPAPVNPIINYQQRKTIRYHSLWSFGLKADRGHFINDVLVDTSPAAPDIIISTPENYPNTLNALNNRLLYVVNGLIFFPHYKDSKVGLLNAAFALDQYPGEFLSVIDFTEMEGFEKVTLTDENCSIFHQDDESITVYISSPYTLSMYNPFYVINGRLHVLPNTYTIIDDNTVAIKISKQRIYNEIGNLTSKQIGWIMGANNEAQIPSFDPNSINVLQYLTTTESALILVPTNQLSFSKSYLNGTGIFKKFTYPVTPSGLLFLQDGSLGDYIVTASSGYGNSISTSIPKSFSVIRDTADLKPGIGSNNASLDFKGTPFSAMLLDIYYL